MEYKICERYKIANIIIGIINLKNMRVADVEKEANLSAGLISRWKKSVPNLKSLLSVTEILNLEVIIRDNKDKEYAIKKAEDIVQIIRKLIKSSGISVHRIEQEAGMSKGIIEKWKKRNPRLECILDVLSVIGAEMIIRNLTIMQEEMIDGIKNLLKNEKYGALENFEKIIDEIDKKELMDYDNLIWNLTQLIQKLTVRE